MTAKHICGICKKAFDTDVLYSSHECLTGFRPKEIEHQDALTGGQASKVSEAAKKRAGKL